MTGQAERIYTLHTELSPTHLPHPPAGVEAVQGCSSFPVDPTLSDTAPLGPQDWQLSL